APAVQVTDSGLLVRNGPSERRVYWQHIEKIHLVAGEVDTPDGTARVHYASLTVTHGPPVAFADLSPLGGGANISLPEASVPIIDVGDPDVLVGLVAERIGASEFLPPAPAPAQGAIPPER